MREPLIWGGLEQLAHALPPPPFSEDILTLYEFIDYIVTGIGGTLLCAFCFFLAKTSEAILEDILGRISLDLITLLGYGTLKLLRLPDSISDNHVICFIVGLAEIITAIYVCVQLFGSGEAADVKV